MGEFPPVEGSAIVEIIENHGAQAGRHIYDYVKEMKEAVMGAASFI